MQTLEELMKSHDDDYEYYKTPSLGKHFSQKWLQEDSEHERKDGELVIIVDDVSKVQYNLNRFKLSTPEQRRQPPTLETKSNGCTIRLRLF